MKPSTKRSVLRWIHIVFGIPVLGYIYSPFKLLPDYAFIARYIAVPVLTLTGFWMWIQLTPKKSILAPVGVLLILLGLVGPIPFTPAGPTAPQGTGHSVAFWVANLFRLGLPIGIVCAVVGIRRNRRLILPPAEEEVQPAA